MDAAASTADLPATPLHVAIIMDGNGRWAKSRGLKRVAGHKQGAESVRVAIDSAIRFGVRYLTLFSFSSENWKRPQTEVSELMQLLRFYLENEIDFLMERSVRLRVIGQRQRLGQKLVSLVTDVERRTEQNRRMTLVVALNYGARQEIADACRQVATQVAAGEIAVRDVDETVIGDALYTRDIPDPDILIRTSGELRISNFLLWQCAYTELVFIDTLWPDFSQADFAFAIEEFQGRERRYGASGG
jgi:undecaprenyl diphosphate synthase